MRLVQLSELANDIHHADDIIQFLQTLLSLRPDALEARRLLRTLELDLWEETQNSRNPMKRIQTQALSLTNRNTLAQAEKAIQERQFGQAMELAEEILATQPSHEKANLILADCAKALELPSTAAFAYEMICYHKEDDLPSLHLLGEAHVAEGDTDSARSIYQRILELNPQDDDAMQSLQQLQHLPPQPANPTHRDFTPSLAPHELEVFPFAEYEGQLEDLENKIVDTANLAKIDPKMQLDLLELEQHHAQVKLQLLYHRAAQNPEDYALRYELGQAYLNNAMFAEAKALFTGVLEHEELRLACFKSLCQCLAKELAQEENLAYNQ